MEFQMRRRTFLLGGGLATAGAVVGYKSLNTPSIDMADLATREHLRFPNIIDASITGKIPLRAQAGNTEFYKGIPSKTLGFNQDYLGPVVKLKNGDYQADVTNTTDQPISVHWHGLIIPGSADGGPHQVVQPGQNWRPEFEIKQAPSTPWFHTHVHGQTASGVYAGLAGGMIISDGLDDQRGLPSNYGVDDLYLILQDKTFDASGRMVGTAVPRNRYNTWISIGEVDLDRCSNYLDSLLEDISDDEKSLKCSNTAKALEAVSKEMKQKMQAEAP